MNFRPSDTVVRGFKIRARKAMFDAGYRYTAELARAIGVNNSTLCAYLNGDFLPNPDTLSKMCLALDVSADYLLGLEKKQ